MHLIKLKVLIFLFLLPQIGCETEKHTSSDSKVAIRLDAEPDRLHPILSRTRPAKIVERHLFLPLLDFDPQTLELVPVLAKQRPIITEVKEGTITKRVTYTFEIREVATWDNGAPILAADYIFTLKVILHPLVRAAAYRSYLNFISDVIIDPENPRKFTVVTNRPYILAEAALGNMEIYPRYFYDPDGLMDAISFRECLDFDQVSELVNKEVRLQDFAKSFNTRSPRTADELSGSGAYFLNKWEANQEIILQRKKDWWGFELAGISDFFVAYPERIHFKIIPDATTASTLLASGQLDAMSGFLPDLFLRLKNKDLVNQEYQFFTTNQMMYSYIGLNGNNTKIADQRVRRALAHLVDVEEVITNLLKGMGERLAGPIHPVKDYYHHGLLPIPFSTQKARNLLEQSGWKDTDKDGILDQIIDGQRVPLRLTFKYKQGNQLAENVGILLQQNARLVGVEIVLDGQELNTMLKQYRQGDFELIYLTWSRPPILDDLRQTWHTSSQEASGSNRSGFGNAESDVLIDQIRVSYDADRRKELYLRIQALIYEAQPYIFLFVPQETIVIHERLNALPSSRFPGFFPNTFQERTNISK